MIGIYCCRVELKCLCKIYELFSKRLSSAVICISVVLSMDFIEIYNINFPQIDFSFFFNLDLEAFSMSKEAINKIFTTNDPTHLTPVFGEILNCLLFSMHFFRFSHTIFND